MAKKLLIFAGEESGTGVYLYGTRQYVSYQEALCVEHPEHEICVFVQGAAAGQERSVIQLPRVRAMKDMWASFSIMMETMAAGDEVVFAIGQTASHYTLLTLLLLHYAKQTLSVTVSGIYYALPSAADTYKIVNLDSFLHLQEWITNAHAAMRTGDAGPLIAWLKQEERGIRREEQQTTPDVKQVELFTHRLQNVFAALATNRAMVLQQEAAAALAQLRAMKQVEVRPQFTPLASFLTAVEGELEQLAAPDPVRSGLEAVRWCIQHGLIQQAYTIARELMTTAVCLKFQLRPDCMEDRAQADLCIALAIRHTEPAPLTGEKEQRFIQCLREHKELLGAADQIQYLRNDINHAGWRPQPMAAKEFYQKTNSWLPLFEQKLLLFWQS